MVALDNTRNNRAVQTEITAPSINPEKYSGIEAENVDPLLRTMTIQLYIPVETAEENEKTLLVSC